MVEREDDIREVDETAADATSHDGTVLANKSAGVHFESLIRLGDGVGPADSAVLRVTGTSTNPIGEIVQIATDGLLDMNGNSAPVPALNFLGGGETRAVSPPLGRLDGVYELRDGTGLLLTEWNSGTLSTWNPGTGLRPLARDFKGPADFCTMGTTVYVPDLVKSELRIVRLGR